MSGRLLNIGCGSVWNEAWTNLDGAPAAPQVRRHDVTRGLPFEDDSVAACYASHVLEHLTRAQASALVAEMHRVLQPSGVARIVVPDLEGIVRLYLQSLEAAAAGQGAREADYDWMVLELLDQMARDVPGGEMGRFLSQANIPNRDFVSSRIGDEARRYWERRATPLRSKVMGKLRAGGWRWVLSFVQARLAALLVLVAAGPGRKAAFDAGVFRQSGEVHRWMYDRFSLRRLLMDAGFSDVRVCSAFESRIPGFDTYGLDVVGGQVRKPDSLFIEALKV